MRQGFLNDGIRTRTVAVLTYMECAQRDCYIKNQEERSQSSPIWNAHLDTFTGFEKQIGRSPHLYGMRHYYFGLFGLRSLVAVLTYMECALWYR